MKQLLFLLLFPAYAMAQYPGNAGQKITLGEQTTADGLVFRGVASIDTVAATSKITRANKQDTSAYLLLDTTTNLLWHYKIGSNAWSQAGGSTFDTTTLNLTTRFATKLNISDTTNMLSPYFRDADTSIIKYVNTYGTQTVNGAKTFTSAVTATRFDPTSNTATGNGMFLPASNVLGFSTANNRRFLIDNNGQLCTDSVSKTTSTWKTFEIGKGVGTTVLGGRLDGSNQFILGTNWYYDGGTNQEYIASGYSTQYFQSNGEHILRTAASGSAGGNITFTDYLKITTLGNVGIGTSTPQSGYRLHVVDSVYVGGNVSASAYTTRSDYDLKDEIQNIGYGINEVMQMQPVKYTYKSNGSTQLGFIAQDLGVITPEVVSFEDKMSVYYNALIPILTKAIQEQQALIKALEQRILTLENK